MKKKIFAAVAAVLCAIGGAAGLAACSDKDDGGHEHTYSDEWSYNALGHWHACTYPGCGSQSGWEHHNGDYVYSEYLNCSVCDYRKSDGKPDDPDDPTVPDGPNVPDTPEVPDTGDGAFAGVTLSEAGVLNWNKIKGASKYVITVTYAGTDEPTSYDVDKSKTSQDLAALRSGGFPSGRSQVTLAAYEIDSVEIEGETIEQEVPMTGVADMFRVTVVNGKYSLARLKYADEYITLDGFYAEKATGADGGKYYLYELVLKDNKSTRLNLSSCVKAAKGGAVKFYKSASGRENNTSSDEYSSSDLMFLSFPHGESKIYVRAAGADGTRDYDLCVYGLYTADIERYAASFTTSGGIRTYDNRKIGETLTVTERDIIAARDLYNGADDGALARSGDYEIIENTDTVFELPAAAYPDGNNAITYRLYFYDEATVRADCAEYAEYAENFNLTESMYGMSLSSNGNKASGGVTVPNIIVGKKVTSVQFFMSDVTTVYIAEGVTEFFVGFSYCNKITDIWLPSTITYMGERAFGNDTSNTLPSSMTVHCAFDASYATANFHYNWNQIAGTFNSFKTVYNDSRPVTVDGVSYKATGGTATVVATSGTNAVIPDTVNIDGVDCDVTRIAAITASGTVKIGKNVTIIDRNAFSHAVEKIEVDAANAAVFVENGVLYTFGKERIVAAQTGVGSLFVEDSNVAIDKNAFTDCSDVTMYVHAEKGECYNWTECDFDNVRLVYNVNDLFDDGDFAYACYFSEETYETEAILLSYNGNAAVVTVPDSVREYAVTQVAAKAFENRTALTEVVIPDSVTVMGMGLFAGCTNLKKVTLPFVGGDRDEHWYLSALTGLDGDCALETVVLTQETAIYRATFRNFVNLKTVEVPDTIESIAWDAFIGCAALQYNEYGGALYIGNAEKLYLILMKAVSTDITECTIPDGVRAIADSAFYGCAALKNIVVPASAVSIGGSAFKGCSSLESLTLPFAGVRRATSRTETGLSVTELFGYSVPQSLATLTVDGCEFISRDAFRDCASVTEIVIGDSITGIGAGAFDGCTGLTRVTLGGLLKNLDNNSGDDVSPFRYCTELQEITVHQNGSFLFENGILYTPLGIQHVLTSIEGEVVIKNTAALGYEGIGTQFRNRDKITNIIIPTNVTKIASGAFKGCTGLTSISIPFVGTSKSSSLSSVSFCAIFGTVNDIPQSLIDVKITGGTAIGTGAFRDCKTIRTITIAASVTKIAGGAFTGTKNTLQSVNLENKTGWTVGGVAYSAMQLGASAVAKMLRDTHYLKEWVRSDS